MTTPTAFSSTVPPDTDFAVLAGAGRTGGSLTVTVATLSGVHGPRVHYRRDAVLVVLEGSCTVDVRGQVLEAAQGSVTFVPRGAVHTVQVASATARVLTLLVPGGAEDLLTALHGRPGASPDVQVRLAADCGAELLLHPPPRPHGGPPFPT